VAQERLRADLRHRTACALRHQLDHAQLNDPSLSDNVKAAPVQIVQALS